MKCCRTCDPAGLGVWTALAVAILAAAGLLSGCSANDDDDDADGVAVTPAGGGDDVPQFTLAWSEYPSWSAFGVADEIGLLDGDAGALGEMERKWGVDVVLKQAEYDSCLTLFADGQVDAVCVTNIDLLPLAPGRKSTVVLPTSTSDGGDACVVVGVDDLDGLKGKETRGLENSVSQYVFERCLEERGEDPAAFPFVNMDPAAAALGMQNGDLESIMVWNPFALSTERNAQGAKRLFDSSEIPGEVIDLVAVGDDSLNKPGGKAFAGCLAETFHAFNARLNGDERDDLLVALGEKFSNLGLDDMKVVVEQTKFYPTAADAEALMTDAAFRDEVMPRIAEFAVDRGLVDAAPAVSFDGGDADLTFSTAYLNAEPAE